MESIEIEYIQGKPQKVGLLIVNNTGLLYETLCRVA